MPILQVLRTRSAAVGADSFPGFGTVLRPCEDPAGIVIEPEMMKSIRLEPTFPKIPPALANRISSLYIEMLAHAPRAGGAVDSAKEISVVLLRDVETMARWRVLVPSQRVGGASVQADFSQPLCDIETGEEVTQFPPDGWAHAGSSHSHNTMSAFFSGVDDRNELPVPGVHFVLGNFKKGEDGGHTFDVAASVVYHNTRYERVIGDDGKPRRMEWHDIAEFTTDPAEHHPDVLNYVKVGYDASASPYSGGITPYDWDDYGAGFRPNVVQRDSFVGSDYLKRHWIDEHMLKPIGEYHEWLVDFDKRMDKVPLNKRDMRPFFHADTPTLMAAATAPKKFEYGEVYRVGVASMLWAIVQRRFGDDEMAVDLITAVKEDDGPVRYYVKASGTNELIEVAPMFARDATARARSQRESLDALRKGGKKRGKGGRFNGGVKEGFRTRGVWASEFTPYEIEKLIEAWMDDPTKKAAIEDAVLYGWDDEHPAK